MNDLTMSIAEQKAQLMRAQADIQAKIEETGKRWRDKTPKERRRRDANQKILIGACILSKVYAGIIPKDHLWATMEAYCINDRDRELFGFSPLSDEEKQHRKELKKAQAQAKNEDQILNDPPFDPDNPLPPLDLI